MNNLDLCVVVTGTGLNPPRNRLTGPAKGCISEPDAILGYEHVVGAQHLVSAAILIHGGEVHRIDFTQGPVTGEILSGNHGVLDADIDVTMLATYNARKKGGG